MSTVTIRNRQYQVVWSASGSLGVSFVHGVFWYEHLPVLKEAALRLREADVMPTAKSLALHPISGNEPLQGNSESPQRLIPRSMVVDLRTATTLNAFAHSGFGLRHHLCIKTWDDVERSWVLTIVSDAETFSEREGEFRQICELLRVHESNFCVKPVVELVFGCPNVKLSLVQMFFDCKLLIENCREDLGSDWTIGANISPIAPVRTFVEAQEAGADYLRICNTIPHWYIPPDKDSPGLPDNIPWRKKSPLQARGFAPGGYSGPMCAPIVLHKLSLVRELVDIPIGFGNGFYSEDLIREGFGRGGDFVSLGMVKLVRPLRVDRLITCAKECALSR